MEDQGLDGIYIRSCHSRFLRDIEADAAGLIRSPNNDPPPFNSKNSQYTTTIY